MFKGAGILGWDQGLQRASLSPGDETDGLSRRRGNLHRPDTVSKRSCRGTRVAPGLLRFQDSVHEQGFGRRGVDPRLQEDPSGHPRDPDQCDQRPYVPYRGSHHFPHRHGVSVRTGHGNRHGCQRLHEG